MDNPLFDVAEVFIAAWLDKEEKKSREIIVREILELKQAEAQCRRAKEDALIRNMAELQRALMKFESSYENKKKKYGSLPYAEDTIRQARLQIKRLSVKKNNL